MRVQRYISTLLLVCFSVFLGHNMIPHHHHSEVLHNPLATNCPIDHEDSHEHEHDAGEQPTHCHAFNAVVFDMYNTLTIRPWTGSIQAMLVPGQLTLPENIQHRSPYEYAILKLPCKSVISLGSVGLRAPPVFA